MEPNYYFFFSYASKNHSNAEQHLRGKNWNFFDQFYDTLCQQVGDMAAKSKDDVAFRDKKRLKTGDIWRNELIHGLQKSSVFLALISPDYLKSDYCGIELSFFNRRIQEFAGQSPDKHEVPHILPIFWEDSEVCFSGLPGSIEDFFKRYNYSEAGMPDNYPAVGLSQILRLQDDVSFQQICRSTAKRIVELSHSGHVLPELPAPQDFNNLDNLYTELTLQDNRNFICEGPASSNVVYLVGTRKEYETEQVNSLSLDVYQDECLSWIPFPEDSKDTIEQLTNEGAKAADIGNLKQPRLFGKFH